MQGSAQRRPTGRRVVRRSGIRSGLYGVGLSLAAVCLLTGVAMQVVPALVPGPTGQPVAAAAVAGVTGVLPNGTVQVPGTPAATRSQPIMALPTPDEPIRFQLPAPYGITPISSPPPAECGTTGTPRQIPPSVVVGPGQGTVSWLAGDDDLVLSYRVTAVSQDLVGGEQPAPPTQVVAQPTDCQEVSATISGLTSGGAYVFWLEEEVLTPRTGEQRYVQLGISEAVVID